MPDFQTAGITPAAFALLAFGLAVPAGVFLRSTIAWWSARSVPSSPRRP